MARYVMMVLKIMPPMLFVKSWDLILSRIVIGVTDASGVLCRITSKQNLMMWIVVVQTGLRVHMMTKKKIVITVKTSSCNVRDIYVQQVNSMMLVSVNSVPQIPTSPIKVLRNLALPVLIPQPLNLARPSVAVQKVQPVLKERCSALLAHQDLSPKMRGHLVAVQMGGSGSGRGKPKVPVCQLVLLEHT
jgi:hypothetical protein